MRYTIKSTLTINFYGTDKIIQIRNMLHAWISFGLTYKIENLFHLKQIFFSLHQGCPKLNKQVDWRKMSKWVILQSALFRALSWPLPAAGEWQTEWFCLAYFSGCWWDTRWRCVAPRVYLQQTEGRPSGRCPYLHTGLGPGPISVFVPHSYLCPAHQSDEIHKYKFCNTGK